MPTSEARMIANRKNAALSTGPKSVEGKAISRANGLKHGLTGLGIVLREDDQAEVERRSLAMIAELQPGTETGLQLVRRAAVLSVRVERCAELETAATSARVRSAWDHFDDDQRDAADALFASLGEKPWATLRRLQRTFQGVDRLIQAWQDLKTDLEANVWTRSHGERLTLLSGYRLDDCHAVRFLKLSEAIEGSPSVENVGPMLAVIDVELDALNELLETFDDDEIAHQRAEAAARALLVPSAEAILARRYEAAPSAACTEPCARPGSSKISPPSPNSLSPRFYPLEPRPHWVRLSRRPNPRPPRPPRRENPSRPRARPSSTPCSPIMPVKREDWGNCIRRRPGRMSMAFPGTPRL